MLTLFRRVRAALILLVFISVAVAGVLSPAVAQDSYRCIDFDTQGEAQAVFDAAPDAHENLDVDGNGVACESLPGGEDVPAETATLPSTPTPVHDRCVAVDTLPNVSDRATFPDRPENEQLIAEIEDGLIDGVTINDVWTVKSDDFENVWFVGTQLHGPALDDDTYTAVWATSRINEDGEYTGVGLILTVGGFANQFSEWGDGGTTDAELSLSDDGAEDAQECAAGEE